MNRGLTNGYLLNVIATVTTTNPNEISDVATKLIHRIFFLNRWQMMNEKRAKSQTRRISETMGIPYHDAISKKISLMTFSLSEIGRKFERLYGGQPFVTLFVVVENGNVSQVVGQFDNGDEELDGRWEEWDSEEAEEENKEEEG